MKSDMRILSDMAGGYQDIGIGVWALTEVIAQARERLNQGKTASHQKRHNENDPLYNYKLGRAGILGEVAILVALKEAGASKPALKHIQAGLLHEDIRLAEHKGAADIALSDQNGTIKHIDVKTSRLMNTTGADGHLKINQRKHKKLTQAGLNAYIGVMAPDYASQVYFLKLITPEQVEAWSLARVDDKGNDYYEAPISHLINFPITYAKRSLHANKYQEIDVHDLAFNNQEFSDTIRAVFPYINWSLV